MIGEFVEVVEDLRGSRERARPGHSLALRHGHRAGPDGQRLLALAVWITVAALVAGCATLGAVESIDSLLKQAVALYEGKRYDEAIAKLRDVLARDPKAWTAYLYLARSYIAKLDWAQAIDSGRQAFELAPQGQDVVPVFAEALWGGGLASLQQGKFREAAANFVDYIKLKPGEGRGYLNAGRAYLGAGAFGDALSVFVRGLGQAGDGGVRRELLDGLIDGGRRALTGGDPRSAIGFLEEYVKIDPSQLAAYLDLGKAYFQAGDRGEALAAYRRALQLSPGNEEALRSLLNLGGR
jgi:tetratricopeptide (TPR) repeat protein